MLSEIKKWFYGFKGKLLLLLLLPVLFLITISTVSTLSIQSQKKDIEGFVAVRVPVTTAIGEMKTNMQANLRYLWAAYAHDANLAKREKFLKEVSLSISNFNSQMERYLSLPILPEARARFSNVPEDWKKLSSAAEEAKALIEKNTSETDKQAKEIIVTKMVDPAISIVEALRAVDKIAADANKKVSEQAELNSSRVQTVVLWVSVFATLLVFSLGFVIASRLSKEISAISEHISQAAHQTSMSTHQLSGASQQLSSAASEAAASLEEILASMSKLSDVVKVNSESLLKARKLSSESNESATRGKQEISKLISSMEEMGVQSKKIEEIIGVIDDIAFQTNLLALNAAVEAARAGDQGRGFAVVAEAVRNLAQRSSSAAKDISGLIKESVHKAEEGSKIASSSGVVLNEIVSTIQQMSGLNHSIAQASEEQLMGLGQVKDAIEQLDKTTQGNAASAEETAASSEEMAAQAVLLNDQVERLRILMDGATKKETNAYSNNVVTLSKSTLQKKAA